MKLDTKNGKLAFSSIFATLALAILFVGAFFPFSEYSVVAIAGIALVPIVIEISRTYAFTAFFCSAVLAFLLLPNKEISLLYTLFFGYYPILKSIFESMKSRFFEFFLKFSVFNVTIVIFFFSSMFLLGISQEQYTIFGFYLPWLFLLLGNGVFLLYDICLTRLIILYTKVIRKKFLGRF